MVFVGEADPVAGGMPDVDMRPTAERTGGEGRGEISGIESMREVWGFEIDEYTLSVEGAIRPLGGGVFWAVDEDNAVGMRVEGGDAAACVVGGLVDGLGEAGLDMNDLDTIAVEDFTGGIRTDVIDDA